LENVTRNPDVILWGWRELFFVLVEIERGVEFRLAQERVNSFAVQRATYCPAASKLSIEAHQLRWA
jgi:hypothetical protein